MPWRYTPTANPPPGSATLHPWLVLVVGTATLATFVSAGGLGVAITTGVNLDLPRVLITGSVLVSLLALAIDWLGRVVEHIARPRGL